MTHGLNRAAVNNSLLALKNYAVEDKGMKVYLFLYCPVATGQVHAFHISWNPVYPTWRKLSGGNLQAGSFVVGIYRRKFCSGKFTGEKFCGGEFTDGKFYGGKFCGGKFIDWTSLLYGAKSMLLSILLMPEYFFFCFFLLAHSVSFRGERSNKEDSHRFASDGANEGTFNAFHFPPLDTPAGNHGSCIRRCRV